MADEANLATARINLSYTDIVAPITGKVGRTNITKGNVVSPESGPLTVIVSQDPMYVSFPVSQRDFLREQAAGRASRHQQRQSAPSFRRWHGISAGRQRQLRRCPGRSQHRHDTRARHFPNPAGMLVDGQFVRIKVESGKPEEKVVISQAALIADQEGVYVFTVEDGKATVKRVKPGSTTDTGGAQVR